MIIFKRIRWRNFLSTGNAWNEIDLNSTKTTLIIGKNGEGKSTFLDAFTFVLFGKPFRNINRPQLLNSINQKNLLVEIEFLIGEKEYLIKRGIKPGIFEIWCDGDLLNQDSETKDYQQVLEEQILKLSYKSCTQIVILGSASFTPFMNLPTGAKRDVIEDLLDIKIFSLMRKVLKDRMSTANVNIINLNSEINIAKEKFALTQKYIDNLKANHSGLLEQKEEYSKQLAAKQAVLYNILDKVGTTGVEYTDLTERQSKVSDTTVTLSKSKYTKEAELKRVNSMLNFFKVNSQCPQCTQEINPDHKHSIETKLEADHKELEAEVKDLSDKHSSASAELQHLVAQIRELGDQQIKVNSEIQGLGNQLKKLRAEIVDIQSNKTDIDAEVKGMKILAGTIADSIRNKNSLNEDLEYLDIAELLLKDTGIKTQIINQYLPTINKLVNKYLQTMDLFVQFELDESFNEVIKSRNRDQFSYASFSEGEKHRINLALLFAWRAVAGLRNTTNTNLLIFDEVLDGSLDDVGVDCFLQMIKEFGSHINIFVITHKQDLFIDKFDRVIQAKKINDYSELEVLEK